MKMQLLLLVILFICDEAVAKTYQVNCPAQIDITQKMNSSKKGWRSVNSSSPHFLNTISMSVEKPENLMLLKPLQSTSIKSTWKFNVNDQISVICGYQDTNIQLTQFLPKQTVECTTWYQSNVKGDKGPIPDRLVCMQK